MSHQSRLATQAALARHYSKVGITIVNSVSDLEGLADGRPDLVFLGVKFIPTNSKEDIQGSNRIWVSEYLEQRGIACTGSARSAHELELDKSLTKGRIQEAGLNTSPYMVARQNKPLTTHGVTPCFPVFVKPIDRGGGLGVDSASLAHNFDELRIKVESIRSGFQADSLIEQYLPGKEFSVAILKDEATSQYSVMPLELVAPLDKNGARFLSAKVKSANVEIFNIVADGATKTQVTELAVDAFHALGARDYGRIDIRLDEFGTAHFLEANLIPSLIKDYGNFPKACSLYMNLDYEAMLLRIVNLALSRESEDDTPQEASKEPLMVPVLGAS